MNSSQIQFLLNDELVELTSIDPNLTVLQYLRQLRHLTGTKEGCASGDCGACTAVVAQVSKQQKLEYSSINTCITFVGNLHGKQLITVEHITDEGKLHPVQQALVDNHGSQCGFCTPGFVMSAFALHKSHAKPSKEKAIEALAGNLCRCTGYRSIIDAAVTPIDKDITDKFAEQQQQTITRLREINNRSMVTLSANGHEYFAPNSLNELSKLLLDKPKAILVAGGTDLALHVTQALGEIDTLVYLGSVPELNDIKETEKTIEIGAAVTYSQITPLLGQYFPELAQMIERIGSTQIRNLGTIGGNIGNASPIGDMPPALMALSASITLQCGDSERTILLENYFKDYKVTDLAESEFIKTIIIPKASNKQVLKIYKISKRIDDDISAVLAAINIELANGIVVDAKIAFGGMAAIPKRASFCEKALITRKFSQENIDTAKLALSKDFQPMSDVRASSQYRTTVSKNLLQKCFIELSSQAIETRVVNYA